jgi:outer membrane protein assembly factor BamB
MAKPNWSRRDIFRILGVGIGFGTVLGGSSQTVTAQSTADELGISWSTSGDSFTGIAQSEERLFVAETSNTDESGSVRAIAKDTGETQWTVDRQSELYRGIAYQSGRVFFGDETLQAVDSETGEQIWEIEEYVSSEPIADNDTVYVILNYNAGSYLFSIDAEQGTTNWRVELYGSSGGFPATLTSEAVYIGGGSRLYALNKSDGSQIWTKDLEEQYIATSDVVDGRIYISTWQSNDDSADNIQALNADDGSEVWGLGVPGHANAPPVVNDGTVYVGTRGHDDNLLAFDATSGDQIWSFGAEAKIDRGPAVADGSVFVGTTQGDFHEVSADTGEELWSQWIGTGVYLPPLVDAESVYIASEGTDIFPGKAYALTEGGGSFPSATISSEINSNPGTTLTLSGTESTAPGGDIVDYQWRVINRDTEEGKTFLTGETVEYTPTSTGTISIKLVVTADNGGVDLEYGSADITTVQQSGGGVPFFNFGSDQSGPAPLLIGGSIVAGAGYYGYQSLVADSDTEESTESTPVSQESTENSMDSTADEIEVDTDYNDYEQHEILSSRGALTISRATGQDHSMPVAMYTPASPGDTIDTTVFEDIVEGFGVWGTVDDHEHIPTVYAHGDTPKPWAAVELADAAFDPAAYTDESLTTKRDMIIDLCEAVHEGHRHGLAHGDLRNATFIDQTPDTPTIKVGDWGITEAAINDKADQQADIDAAVDIAFELFTGESPSTGDPDSVSYPDGLESVFQTAWDDEGGYETVIHFRDAITEAI